MMFKNGRVKVKKTNIKRLLKVNITLLVVASLMVGNITITKKVSAAEDNIVNLGQGSIAGSVTTEMSFFASKLPSKENSGIYRFTTENYDNNNGAIDTNNWATSAMWNHDEGNYYSGSIYANPMSYWATKEGMWISKPSTRIGSTYVVMTQYNDGAFTDFNIKPEFEFSNAKVDKVTDWTYDVVMENKNNSSQYIKTTMTQGSPFGFFQLANSKKVDIVRKRANKESVIVYYNGTSLSNSTYAVIRVADPDDSEEGYPAYDYYAIYVSSGTTWSQSGNTSTSVGTISLEFSSNEKAYFSVAWLCESEKNDNEAKTIAEEYSKYAYNFITDTRADFSYNENTASVTTTYKYTVDKKTESKAEGTIMGIMPHQYKNMAESNFLSNTARTIRGNVKYKIGSSFTTSLKFGGVLPYAPTIEEADKTTLAGYVDEFMSSKMPTNAPYLLCVDEASGDPYTYGKQFNRSSNVMAAAEQINDTDSADRILNGMKKSLTDWFTYTGAGDAKYFAYDEGIGSLYSQPNSFNSIDQMNDHHFHYGYFIAAAAQIALRDKEWAKKYDLVVQELINDVASTERNNKDSRYPYLRNFSPFEGHSWASGFEDINSGNNQESTSEAMNAWYGIILYGMATDNDQIRDLGIYLYTTELSAINCYWFDIYGDVLDQKYVYQGGSQKKNVMASLVWSGKYDYATWFSGDPACVQGIQLLPITAGSYYLATDKEYIKEYVQGLNNRGNSGAWNDVWSEYLAMSDPDAGFNNWSGKVSEDGETLAHTFHHIKSLQKHGTPELSITSNMPLSMVFKKSNGEKTYVVYNADSKMKTVQFSDGAMFSAKSSKMTIMTEKDMEGEEYFTEYYIENKDGSYSLFNTDIGYGEVGDTVTAKQETINGYKVNTSYKDTVLSGKITTSGTTLKLYYDREIYTINYQLDGGVNGDNPTNYTYGDNHLLQNPVKEDYIFRGWYTDENYQNKIENITEETYGNLTLYARWAANSDYYIDDNHYLRFVNGTATFFVENSDATEGIIALYKIYDTKEQAMSAVQDRNIAGYVGLQMNNNGGKWSVSADLSSHTDKYLVFVFNMMSGTNSGLSDWGCCQIAEGLTQVPVEPTTGEQSGGSTTKPEENDTLPSGPTGDYSKLTYVAINGDYDIACLSGDNSIINRTIDEGSTLYIANNAIPGVLLANYQSVTVNGVVDNNPRAGANFWVTKAQLSKRYNVISIVGAAGTKCDFIIRANSIQDETTKPIESETTSYTETTSDNNPTDPPTIPEESTTNLLVETTSNEIESTEITSSETVFDQTTFNNTTSEEDNKVENPSKDTSKKIKISKAKITKLKARSRNLYIKVKRIKGITGYQVQISTSRKFRKSKTKIRYYKKISFVTRGLKKGKKYYIRVRGYKKIKGKKYFGRWSSRRRINIKK